MNTAPNKFKVLKVKDKNDDNSIRFNRVFDLPMRLLLTGASGSGKSNFLVNILLNENYGYKNIFDGDDIYIFAPSPFSDNKLNLIIEQKEIPESNIYGGDFNDGLLDGLYEDLVEDYQEAIDEKKKPTHKLIILDDLSFSGSFASRFNVLAKLYQNGRKYLVNVICLAQYYKQVTSAIRMNSSGIAVWRTPNSQLEAFESEHNYLRNGKKAFIGMYKDHVVERTDFMIINYSNSSKELYLDKDFNNITPVDKAFTKKLEKQQLKLK